MFFDNLIIKTCMTTTTSAIGQKACDQLDPQSAPVGPNYPANTEWRTTQATYIPGSTKLAVNGIYQTGYTESDPTNGLILTPYEIATSAIVTLCYLTNGPLP
jgi:hypothetical protein